MNSLFRTCLLSLSALLFFFYAPSAHALTISPLRQTLVVDPGTTGEAQLTVTNELNTPVTIRPTVGSFSIDERSGVAIFGEEDTAIAWVIPKTSLVTLEPRETKTIFFDVRVPAGSLPASHYLALFAKQEPAPGQIGVGTRLGSLLFFHVAGSVNEQMLLQDFSSEKRYYTSDGPLVHLQLKNIGSIHLDPQGQLIFTNWFGEKIARQGVNPNHKKVLPDGIWRQSYQLGHPGILDAGKHRVTLQMQYGLSKQTLTAELTYWYVPTALLSIPAAVLIILIGMWAYRRRRKTSGFFLGLMLGISMSLGLLQMVRADETEDVTVNATVPSICGNGAVEAGEDCEGADLNGGSCVAEGFDAGDLSCNANCTYNTSACTNNNNGGNQGGGPAHPPVPQVNPPAEPGDEEPEDEEPGDEEPPVDEEPADEEPDEKPEPPGDDGPDEQPQPGPGEEPGEEEPGGEQLPDDEDAPDDGEPAAAEGDEPGDEEGPGAEDGPDGEGPPGGEGEEDGGAPGEDDGVAPGDAAEGEGAPGEDNQPPDPDAPIPDLDAPPAPAAEPDPVAAAEEAAAEVFNDWLGPLARNRGGAVISEFTFWIATRSIQIGPTENGVHTIAGDIVTVATRRPEQTDRIESLFLSINGKDVLFKKEDGLWYANVRMPAPGSYTATITMQLKNGSVQKRQIPFVSHGIGIVTDRQTDAPVKGARVTLYRLNEGNAVWNAMPFGQQNPLTTGVDGHYGFIVPNGDYKLIVSAERYRSRETFSFSVRDHVVNEDVRLILVPPPLGEVPEALTSDMSFWERLRQAAGVAADVVVANTGIALERTGDVARKVDDTSDEPVVEGVAEGVVAPSATGVAMAAIVPAIATNSLLFLRYIFLQPLLLLGRRKRREWGVVYNSLTKLPVDLAVVRLVDAATRKVKQSRVTDTAGRFLFFAEIGDYQVEVTKAGFTFPTGVLRGVQTDGEYLDVYHGEVVTVTTDGVSITPNIPVDPAGMYVTPKRIIRQKRLQVAQHIISITGIVFAAVSMYITPSLLVGIVLFIHVVLYSGFRRFVKPKKPNGWGLVSDAGTKEGISQAVVRLFTKEYNKLVATQVTDRKGRYAFLVGGPNQYYVTSEKIGYQQARTEDIEVKAGKLKTGAVLKKDIALQKLRKAG